MRFATALLLYLVLARSPRSQAPAQATLVAEVGGQVALPSGSTAPVAALGLPFSNGDGEVAFTGALVGPTRTEGFVFFDIAVRWRNGDAPAATPLAGHEAWMSAGDDGQFIYSPTVGGEDGVWTDVGLLVRRGDPAPGFPGRFISFASRPGLLPGGPSHWVSGVATTADGPTAFRAFYLSPDRTAASATVALAEGQAVGGAVVSALDFSYGLSDDGAHRTFIVTRATGSAANDDAVVLDGAVVAQEGSPVAAGSPELWSAFDLVRVNDAGSHLMSGDTAGATASDEFVAYNGRVALREGSTVDGVTLGSEVRGLGLNNAGVAVWAWTTSGGTTDEALFVGAAADLARSSKLVLRTGQGLDTTGDGVADYTVADFEFASGDGHGALDLGAAPVVYARLDLTPSGGGQNRNAIVGLDLSSFDPVAGEPTGDGPSSVDLAVAPNPFGEGVTLALSLDRAQSVTVEVLDVLGRRLALLHDGPMAAGAAHRLRLNGGALPAGLYLVRARGEGWATTRRVTRVE